MSCVYAFSVLLFSTTAHANPSSTVGSLGDPERIQIEGSKTFPESMLKDALMADLDVILDSVPTADRNSLIRTLETRLKAGFLNAGFVDCTILASLDPGESTLTLKVIEGEQYTAKPPRFDGLSPELEAKLKATDAYRALVTDTWGFGSPSTLYRVYIFSIR